MSALTIGKLAREVGVGVETIRFYERKGLIDQPPKPRGGGFRVYPAEMIERIRFIRQAQGLNFSLHEIHELLSLSDDPSTNCAEVRDRAHAKLGEINQKIAGLDQTRVTLETLIAACDSVEEPRTCPITEALKTRKSSPNKSNSRRQSRVE